MPSSPMAKSLVIADLPMLEEKKIHSETLAKSEPRDKAPTVRNT